MLTQTSLNARVLTRPFVPVRIITSAGGLYDVYHPDAVSVGKLIVRVAAASAGNPIGIERFSYLSVLHIVALEDLPPRTTTGPANEPAS